MSFVWMFLLGCTVPLIGKVFWPKGTPDEIFVAVLLGLAGSVGAGLVVRGVGLGDTANGLLVAAACLLGAVLLVYGYGVVRAVLGRGGTSA